ncbi:hypothetical protein B0T17DRAFT_518402 [Bombardia bombarda]|uniref:Eisosome protein 1 n=1 Tax=Bombardia bombarda TaxID=252184 RepID=A0AA39XLF7_9PEZI|nr:hypothetical protein B0T17DRAFT_518402 [Bombardia bombarda]
MAPAWESQRNAAGSQAAVLAAGSAQQRRQQRQSETPSAWGNSAANLAFQASRTPPSASEAPDLSRQGSMSAAKGAMAGLRPRSQSSPLTPRDSYPDQANASSNALSAATFANRPAMRTMNVPAQDTGAIPYTTMNRLMFTSNPPVKLEMDEKNRADVLHASAVAMAKRMYTQQQKMINTTKAHARSSSFTRHGEAGSAGPDDDDQPAPMRFDNLQEAAYKLAQERLAKLHDDNQKNREYHEYYGAQPQRKFGTIRNKLTRRRSSSDGDLFVEDQKRSQQIRRQMSIFNTKLVEVDEQKRTHDREALLAAAQRNVKARLQDMDDKLFAETGRVAPSTMNDWEVKAHAAAQARFDASRDDNRRKIDLGGGKFMEKAEVDEIAAKKVQPLLDEINENAERERERKLQQKLDEEKQKEEAEINRLREKEVQEIHKKLKEQQKEEDKARKAEIKHEEKARKQEEKAAKIEQKRHSRADGKNKDKEVLVVPESPELDEQEHRQEQELEKEGQQHQVAKSPTEQSPQAVVDTEHTTTAGGHRSKALSISFPKLSKHSKDKDASNAAALSPVEKSAGEDSSPPTSKVKSWLKERFHRPRAKSSGAAAGTFSHHVRSDSTDTNKSSFIGGAALAKRLHSRNNSLPTIDNRSASMREVAMAGRMAEDEPGQSSSANADAAAVVAAVESARPVSSVVDEQLQLQQRRDRNIDENENRNDDDIEQQSIVRSVSSLSSSGGGGGGDKVGDVVDVHNDDDDDDEDDDKFQDARSEPERLLTPPPPLAARAMLDTSPRRGSPARGSRFSEILE